MDLGGGQRTASGDLVVNDLAEGEVVGAAFGEFRFDADGRSCFFVVPQCF